MMKENMTFCAPCLLGVEGLVAEELRDMGCENVRAENGRVLFEGDYATLVRANLNSRYSERILILLKSFRATTFEQLFEGVKSIPWENFLHQEDEFPVSGSSLSSKLYSVPDCQAIIKKAVVERLKTKYHVSWFQETGPLHRIRFRLLKDEASVMLDTSGEGLHKRGYRRNSAEAPIKETLAACLVKLARVRPDGNFIDPAAGSGSLLLQAKKQFDAHIIEDGFFGQEINHTTYNLARMNMFLHNVNYDKFHIALGNTLTDPQFGDEKPFDAIVSNPPYSINWVGSDDPTLINDNRFAPAGVLAPKSKADFAFVLHCLSYLSSKGRAAIVCFPGIFYRGGAEQKIRQYLVDNNFVETVISLASNLFYGTSIAVNILVLSKHKSDTKVQFIDASGEEFFKKETNNNVLTKDHIEKILELFDRKEDIAHVAKSVDKDQIAEANYNLSVSSYVEAKDTREVIDINVLNAEIKTIVAKIDKLRAEIDEIIAEIEV